jgi:hypothetical protein
MRTPTHDGKLPRSWPQIAREHVRNKLADREFDTAPVGSSAGLRLTDILLFLRPITEEAPP